MYESLQSTIYQELPRPYLGFSLRIKFTVHLELIRWTRLIKKTTALDCCLLAVSGAMHRKIYTASEYILEGVT